MTETSIIWHNGTLKPWGEATVHVTAHALHYGSSVFEGMRAYATPKGPMGFRFRDHLERMADSARIYRIAMPYDTESLLRASSETILANQLSSAYVRPIVFRGPCGFGVRAAPDGPVEVAIAALPWGAYLGEGARNAGVDVCISSWARLAPNTMPSAAKAAGNYLSSQLISMEAARHGYSEGIGLTVDGALSEGAGENLFLVRNGILYTPPQAASLLAGITRDSVIQLAKSLDLGVVEQTLSREALYLADEAFFTGTAAEITPIRSVDGIALRSAGRGPVTQCIQEAFFGLFSDPANDRWGWLEPIVNQEKAHREPAAIAV